MKNLEKIKEMLCAELDQYSRKGELSTGSLDVIHKLTDTIKNIGKIEKQEQDADEEGESSYAGRQGRGRNARRDSMGRYSRDGGSYYAEESYDGGSSNRGYSREGGRGGNRGGYSRENGYSRDDGKEMMIEQLEDMAETADTKSREAIRRAIKQIENA